jgi:hypothetical protein
MLTKKHFTGMRKINPEEIFYERKYQARDNLEYDLIYVAIDTNPRVNHRIFNNDLKTNYVFFNEERSAAVRFNKEGGTIEWTNGADEILKEIFNNINNPNKEN